LLRESILKPKIQEKLVKIILLWLKLYNLTPNELVMQMVEKLANAQYIPSGDQTIQLIG